jgi:virginiamycin A acetyltransferase
MIGELAKSTARALATIVIVPRVIAFRVFALILGGDRAFESAVQAIARMPGVRGQYLRNAFLRRAIRRCDPTATLCFGTLLSKTGAIIDDHVYVGPGCHLGLVHLERDVLLAAGVHVPSGAHLHGTDDPDTPIRDQPGRPVMVTIGAGSWIGSGAIVLADVGRNCVIGAGSVVTKPIPDNVVAVGNPARVISNRVAAESESPEQHSHL